MKASINRDSPHYNTALHLPGIVVYVDGVAQTYCHTFDTDAGEAIVFRYDKKAGRLVRSADGKYVEQDVVKGKVEVKIDTAKLPEVFKECDTIEKLCERAGSWINAVEKRHDETPVAPMHRQSMGAELAQGANPSSP